MTQPNTPEANKSLDNNILVLVHIGSYETSAVDEVVVITHVPDSVAQALTVVRMVPNTLVPDVRRAVSTTVRTAASPSAAHIAR
jgi:hypothetical protein